MTTDSTISDVLAGRAKWCVVTGDCIDVLRTIPAGSVDAVVTDPPFGIGFKYATHIDTPEGYGAWLWDRVRASEAACRAGSPVFVWQSGTNVRRFAEWFPREWRIFAACKNFVQIRPTPMQWSHDPVVAWWTDGVPWNGGGGRDFHIADTTPHGRDYVEGHPCPRPVGQVRYVVDSWALSKGLVLDPFCGSGTTGVACMQTGRRFIGIEIDEGYAAIARRRIAEAANHLFQETK